MYTVEQILKAGAEGEISPIDVNHLIDVLKRLYGSDESPNGQQTDVSGSACEGSCEVHKGEVIPVIIEGHGWDGIKFNYCQEAIEEDERRGFVVRHDR